MSTAQENRHSCLDSAVRWRREATNLRQHAQQPRLHPEVRASLRRSAESCDAQADWWLKGLIEDEKHAARTSRGDG